MPKSVRIGLALAALLGTSAAAAAEREPRKVTEEPRPVSEDAEQDHLTPSTGDRALATGAAIVPGIVVHGAGHYVLGDSSTAGKLLLAEGIGLGMVAAGGAGLFLTGASRYTVGPLAAISMFGVGVFSLALGADVYGVTTSDQGASEARRGLGPTRFESEFGYRYVYTPNFAYRDFLVERFTFWLDHTRVTPWALFSFAGDNVRYRLELAQRLLGPGVGERAPYEDRLELEIAGTHHRYLPESFQRTTGELAVRGRWDLGHLGPSLRGAFVEGSLGYAYNVTAFDYPGISVEDDHDDLLLGTMAFGVLLRGFTAPGSEVTLYYDHRHDGLVAGFTMPGLGSGVAGHFGVTGRVYLDENWGITAEAAAGSAVTWGASLLFREGAPR
jgi:hypothetical protein